MTHPSAVQTLRRQFWVPLLCGVLAVVGAHVLATRQPPQYDALALLRIGDPHVINDALGMVEETPIENTLVAISAQIHQPRTARRAAELLKPDLRLTPAEILAGSKTAIDGSRGLVGVGARAEDPVDAAKIANAMAKAYLELGPQGDLGRIHQTRVQLQHLARQRAHQTRVQLQHLARQPAHRARTNPEPASDLPALQGRIDHLRLIEAIRPQTITLAQAAGPPSTPSGTSPRQISLFAGFAGVIAGVVVVALASYRDRRIRDVRVLARLLRAPVLSEVPRTRRLERRVPLVNLEPRDLEPFRLIVARLRRGPSSQRARSVAITSATTDDGTATIAWYLAATAAADGARTLLLETDPARSSATAVDRMNGGRGVTDLLAGAKISDVANNVEVESGRGMDVVPPGSPNGTVRTADSEAIVRLLASAESTYEVIVIQSPPPSTTSDAIPFILAANRVVVVCHTGRTTREEAENLYATLDTLGVSPLGVMTVGFD